VLFRSSHAYQKTDENETFHPGPIAVGHQGIESHFGLFMGFPSGECDALVRP
jgi:hypothetical protein